MATAAEGYNPLDAAPYTPVQTPDPAPAKPSPLPEGPGFQFQGHGNISHAGAIAGVMDNVLRGYVNGHAQGEAHKALTLKKSSDDLNASYNANASRLYQMSRAGVDPSTPEYQAAKSAVDGSWAALQNFRETLINPDGGKKKSKGKQAQGADASNPLMALTNPASSPQDKAQAMYAISKKLGPPVYGQIATLNTTQAKQARATQDTTAQAGGVHASNTLTHEQAQATYDKYAGRTEEQMAALPQAEQDAFKNAHAIIFPPTTKGTTRLYASPDGKAKEWFVPGNEPEGWNASTAAGKPVRAFVKRDGKFTSVMLDPSTNQIVPGSENPEIQPPASLAGRISTGFFHYVDANGDVHQIAETRTSTPMASAAGGGTTPATTPKDQRTPPASPASSSAAASSASAAPTRRAKVPAPVSLHPAAAGSPTGAPGDRILGHRGTPEEVKARETADIAEKAFRESMDRLKDRGPNGTVPAIAQTGIVFDWVRTQVAGAGRMTNTEIEQALNSGSWDTKFSNAYHKAHDGGLDPAFLKSIVHDMGISARSARIQAKSYEKNSEKQVTSVTKKDGEMVYNTKTGKLE